VEFNGAPVTPSSVSKSGATTTISYLVPNPPLASGSTNSAGLTVKDNRGISYSRQETFVVATYATLPTAAALPASAVDKTAKGFKIKTYQIDGGTPAGTIAYNEDLLAGNLGPNVATASAAGGVDTNGYYTWPGVINFDTTITAQNGYFNDPDYTDSDFPGIPGDTGSIANFAEEILAALEFTNTGMYTVAVNTDWTGFPNATDGYQVRVGVNPLNAASSTVVGFFDANAPAGPARGVANSPFQFYVTKAGIYPFRLLYYQSTGSANLEWFVVNPDGTRTLINDPDKSDAVPAYYKWTTPPQGPTLSISRSASGITITFEGTLQSATTINGNWTDVPGNSPMPVSATEPHVFYRSKR
jgi:hypothetical protein